MPKGFSYREAFKKLDLQAVKQEMEMLIIHAWKSAGNGRGPWWNAGAGHMSRACPTSIGGVGGRQGKPCLLPDPSVNFLI